MSERPTDGDIPPAKKRGSSRQLTKDDGSDAEEEPVQAGVFARASEDVIKQRKIVKARRPGGSTVPGPGGGTNPFAGVNLQQANPNPFSGISLIPPKQDAQSNGKDKPSTLHPEGEPVAQNGEIMEQRTDEPAKPTDHSEVPVGSEVDNGVTLAADAQPKQSGHEGPANPKSPVFGSSGTSSLFSSFAGVSSSAFAKTAQSGSSFAANQTGFSFTSTLPCGTGGFAFASASGEKGAPDLQPVRSVFGGPSGQASVAGTGSEKPIALAQLAETDAKTGEEDEQCVFSGEGSLFELDASNNWRERGRGEMHVNVATTGQARLVMRQRGNFRLLLNARVWPDMPLTRMEGGKAATFQCLNGLGEPTADAGTKEMDQKLSTYAFRLKCPDKVEEFIKTVSTFKGDDAAKDDEKGTEVDQATCANEETTS